MSRAWPAAPAGGRVVSLGSVNVDRVHELPPEERARLEGREWFPAVDETRTHPRSPSDLGEPDALSHGGKGANQAVAAAAAGAETTLLGCVGPDAEEAGVREALSDAGVDTRHLRAVDAPTGTAHVLREPTGEVRILVVPGANARLDRAYLDGVAPVVRRADCLLVQNEVPAEPVRSLLAELADPPTVVYDPAPAAGAESLLAVADYCLPNDREYDRLAGALADVDGVVRTRGDQGAVLPDGTTVSAPDVSVVDETGAGDVLAGYLAAGLAAGVDLRTAARTAVVAASLSTRAAGARGGIPDRETVAAHDPAGD